MDSVVKSMSDLVKVKEEDQITPYVNDPESGGEVDVAKEQLGVLVKIQHDLKRQQVVQQASLTSQFLLGKMQETMAKLLTERSKDFERQRKEMMLYMEKESNLHQNSMDQIENVVEKVGTTLDQFTASLTTLSVTIKDLSADQRTQGRDHLDMLGRIHYEIQGTKELIGHELRDTSDQQFLLFSWCGFSIPANDWFLERLNDWKRSALTEMMMPLQFPQQHWISNLRHLAPTTVEIA